MKSSRDQGAPVWMERNTPPPDTGSRSWSWLWWTIGGAIALFFGYGFYASNTPEGKAVAGARRAIEYCWAEQQRKSLNSSSQQFIAGACERMEKEFRDTYNRSP